MWQLRVAPLRVVAVPALALVAGLALAPAAGQADPARPKVPVVTSVPDMLAAPSITQAIPAPQPGYTPAIAATGETTGTTAFLFYTGTDGHAYAADPADTSTVDSLGGLLRSGPAATFVPPGDLQGPGIAVFGRGTDDAVWAYTGSGWASLGGRITSKPATTAGKPLVSTAGDTLDVIARGTDGAVWLKSLTATTESRWTSLGGQVLAGSSPAAVYVGGRLYVLAIGTNHALWVKSSADGAAWTGWRTLGGWLDGALGAAAPASDIGVVFARGRDGAAWSLQFAGATPGVTPAWHRLGGVLTSGLGAASAADGKTWLVAMGGDNRIWGRSGTWPTLSGWAKVL